MEKSPIPEELRRSFDETLLTMNELTEEANALLLKFGNQSKLYKKKVAQVATLRTFYSLNAGYIERLLKITIETGAAAIAADVCLFQQTHNLGYRQACEILGYKFSEAHINTVETIDSIIESVMSTKASINDGKI